MRRLLLSSAVAMAAAFATPAQAAESISETLTFTAGSAIFGASKTSGGAFTDTFTFDLTEDAIGSGAVLTIGAIAEGPLLDVDLTSVTISGAQGTTSFTSFPFGDFLEIYALLGVPLQAGLQTITVIGDVDSEGGGSYAALFNVTGGVGVSPVPEPASWLAMLAGFTAIGYAMRQRNRQRPQQAV